MMRGKLIMKMRKIQAKNLKKFTVDKVKDEQNFRIEDEVTEDSAKQMEVKEYSCDECEYYVKYLNNLKRHMLAQQKGVKIFCDPCSCYQ